MKISKRRIFYGWWIVLASLGILAVQAGTGFYAYGVLMKPLMVEFGWSRGITSVAQTIFLLCMSVGGLLAAKYIPKWGVKKVAFIGALVNGSGFLLLSLTPNLLYLYIIYILVGLGSGWTGMIPVGVMISNWFNRKIGTAMGIATVGIALGALVLVPLIGLVIENLNWHVAYLFMGCVVFFIDVPLVLFVVKLSPAEKGLYPDGDKPPETSQLDTVTVAANGTEKLINSPHTEGSTSWIGNPFLWLVSLGFLFCNIGEMAILTHEVAFITDMSISATVAAVAFGFTGAFGAIGKLGFGWLTDKFSTRYVTMLCFALQMVGVFILMRVNSIVMVWWFVAVFGIGMGGVATLLPIAINNIFGKTNFGVIYAFVHLLVMGGSTAGPPLAGFIYDTTNSYSIAFIVFLATYFLSIVFTYFAFGLSPRPIKNLRKSV
jgi:MFS family permease